MSTVSIVQNQNFRPLGINTPVSLGTTSIPTQVRATNSQTVCGSTVVTVTDPGASVRVTNPSATVTVYARSGPVGVVATTADAPVPPNSSLMLELPGQVTHVAVIADAVGPTIVGVQLASGLNQ